MTARYGRVFFMSACLVFLLSSFFSSPVWAGELIDKVKETTDKIIAIVSNPEMKKAEKAAERKRLIREAIDERFDWDEMAKRTLARHWAGRSDAEKKEFVALFGKLLERTYLDKVEGYSGEKVNYEDETIDGQYGTVKVGIITTQDKSISVFYRLKKIGSDWFVYDISIEGVSLINNYRNQFNSIITKSSFQNLMERLKSNVEEGK
ncbi:ABC transporter substrate-binding protein [bacterium]|nr:ABC transporter substrate-binding protein [bacterium]NCP10162.1 ABC transporter substrate-binding protein [bacterium]